MSNPNDYSEIPASDDPDDPLNDTIDYASAAHEDIARLKGLLREADRLLRVRLLSELQGSPTEDERALMKKIESEVGA